ncbi:histone H2A [Clonorchis sinensis]|uniref:Histone H2A n=1 Tax=Clonorchis sinensis TaxID=79923 RepID=G7YSJ0_CLOSI|nr:histone H2A [Clonorchis sinensis]
MLYQKGPRCLSFNVSENMSGRGKCGKTRVKAKTRSSRAGLQFPIGRVHRLLRKGNYAERVGDGAPVSLARMAPGCDPTVFFASLQQSLDRVLPGLDGASRHQLPSNQFVEGVQPALGVQLRLARATGQLSVERLVHLARKLAESPLATFQSQENRRDSTAEDLESKVDQRTEQLATVKTESRRHARKSRCYRCGMPGHWRNQCPRTRPLVHSRIWEYSSFPGWVAISALTQATIQAVIETDGKRELYLIDTGAGVSLRRREDQAERRPCALAVRAVGGYRLQIDGLPMPSIRLGDKSVQRTDSRIHGLVHRSEASAQVSRVGCVLVVQQLSFT